MSGLETRGGKKPITNIKDKVYGRLTVTGRCGYLSDKPAWTCLCECGGQTTATGADLKSGHVSSCGCLRVERLKAKLAVNILGERFGKLVALEDVGSKKGEGVLWRCICDCGVEAKKTTKELRTRRHKTCGCGQFDGIRAYVESMRHENPVCTVVGCGGKTLAKGLCSGHYSRLKAGRSVDDEPLRRHDYDEICSIIGCGRPQYSRGYCGTHYKRRGIDEMEAPVGLQTSYQLGDLQAHAALLGGVCLSEVYIGTATEYRWRCEFGHVWDAPWVRIRHLASWCPQCKSGRGERICRAAFEQMFRADFPPAWPAWLRPPERKRGLQLDGYSEIRGVAFEYQGRQHYESFGHFSDEDVESGMARDAAKRRLCWERGISLAVVPYFKRFVDINAVLTQIEYSIICAGIKIPKNWSKNRPTNILQLETANRKVAGPATQRKIELPQQSGRLL